MVTSGGSTRGYIQATDTNDAHLIIATSGGEDICFKDGGLSGTTNMTILGNGDIKLNGYGGGSRTGTVAKYLAVKSDGVIIETDGTGSGGGSGTVSSSTTTSSTTDGEVAIYTDSTTVKQAAKLYYNGSDDSLTIGQTSSASGASSTNPLYVNGGVRASTFMDKGSTTYWLKPAGDSNYVSGQMGGGLFCYGLSFDVSAPSGFAGIYGKYVSSTVRLFAADGYHNTQISPHNEDGDWEFNSTNTRTKKRTRINMTKLIRKIEELTGEEFIMEDFVE